ncbi:phosphotransferase [Pseudonocardia alaniniphila]|uniref:Phosphotransferase n=1 Tax=Pseudonocardia alaniniphila TaxID=75291 RepID=A0ABS9TSX4_9PSEU|nr:phosphotransferase [Pseudonocardia alaniniphila]MCH6171640.1 phosphotransferase [Pseudonocardia alaniniphila]
MTGTWLRHRTATAHVDGAAPVVGVASTAVAGFAFWLVAARLYPAAMVGVIVVALSAMQLLTGIAQLNLNQALHRSAAGPHDHRRIGRAYLVSAMLMAAGAVAVVAAASFWAPELLGYAGRVPLLEFFIPATIIWSFFALQDSVVAAAARGGSLPVGNVVLALLKIMLLAIAVVWALQDGSTFTWALAVAAVVACAVGYLFLRALADREATPVQQSGLDHAGRLLWSAAVHGLPLLVLVVIGPVHAAVYGIVWTIGFSLHLVSSTIGHALTPQAVAAPEGAPTARRDMERRALTLLLPAVVLIEVTAPFVLRIFGPEYAELGSTALRIAAWSAIPGIVTTSAISMARARKRGAVLFVVPAAVATITIGLSLILVPRWGLIGIATAWLVGQSLVATVVLVLRATWLPPQLDAPLSAVRHARLLARLRYAAGGQVLSGGDWGTSRILSGGSQGLVVAVGHQDGTDSVLKVAATPVSREALTRECTTLLALHANPRVGSWRRLVPELVSDGAAGGISYARHTRLPGRPATDVTDAAVQERVAADAVATISELHRRTAYATPATEEHLARWISRRAAVVREHVPRADHDRLDQVEQLLIEELRDRRVALGWTHGDYTAPNVIVADDGAVCGVVDWEQGDPAGPTMLDPVAFRLIAAVQAGREELGAVVVRWSADGGPYAGELADLQRRLGADPLHPRALVLFGWLHVVALSIEKSARFAANPVWMRRNVRMVLRDAVLEPVGRAHHR